MEGVGCVESNGRVDGGKGGNHLWINSKSDFQGASRLNHHINYNKPVDMVEG